MTCQKISNISDNIYSSDNSSSPSLDEVTSHQEPMHHINYSTSTSDTEIPSFDLPEHRCSSPFLQDISDVSLSEYVNREEADTSLEIIYEKNHEDMGNWSLDSQRPHFVATQEEFESKKKKFLEAIANGQIQYWNNNLEDIDPRDKTTPASNPPPPISSMCKTPPNKISILNRTIRRGRPKKEVVLKIKSLIQSELKHDRTETTESENNRLWLLCASERHKRNLSKIPEQSKHLIKQLYRPLFLYVLHPSIFDNPEKNADIYNMFYNL